MTVLDDGERVLSDNWSPLRRRLWLAFVASLIGVVFLMVTPALYRARHDWYGIHGQVGLVTAMSLGASLLFPLAALGLGLLRRARSFLNTWSPIALLGAISLAVLMLFIFDRPSAAGAQGFLDAGLSHRAKDEALALIELGVDSGVGQRIFDDAHLQLVSNASTLAEVEREISGNWFSPSAHARADELWRADVMTEIGAAEQRADAQYLRYLHRYDDLIGPNEARALDRRIALVDLDSCLTVGALACVEDKLAVAERLGVSESRLEKQREQSADLAQAQLTALTQRRPSPHFTTALVSHLESELMVARSHERLAGDLAQPSTTEIGTLLEATRRRSAAEASRAAVEAARAAEQARRERERADAVVRREQAAHQRALEQRRRANVPLCCCDGSFSPTCRRGRSRRGCCSHHGGVCGQTACGR